MPVYVGLDIGGSKLMVAAGDADGRVARRTRAATPAEPAEGIDRLNAMIAEVAGGEAVAGIGVAIGGPLDWRTGVVSPLHQPRWRDLPLGETLGERWGCACHVDVDTNVAALGEYHLTGETAERFVYLTLSTGMGGGLLLDGRLYRGAGGAHPEMAHQAIAYRCSHPERIACECGGGDCLEALVSGNGIRRIYAKPAEQLSGPEWAEVACNLGQGLRNVAALYAPDVIAVGGGIACGRGEALLGPAREVMAEHLKIVPAPQVRLSRHGYHTALLGALWVGSHGLAGPPTDGDSAAETGSSRPI